MKHALSRDLLVLVGLALLLFVLNLWGYPLFDVDEPRYAETAREMLTSPGDWITPHFNWMTRFDKPVLFYWLIAGMYKLLGVSAFSARLVSALAATGILLMVYGVLRTCLNRRAGLWAAIIFATMLEPYAMARWSITDMTLSCFMAGTWLGLLLVLLRSPRWYLVAGIFAGLGVLTKGPVALALPGLTFLLALAFFHRSQWRVLLSPWMFVGLALFLGISLPWYLAVAQANPADFVGSFFIFHNVDRFTSTVSGHAGPWYYYFIVLLIGGCPWILLAPGLLPLWRAQKGTIPPVIRYAALWLALVFVFFSLAGTKLLTYVLPGFPALAMLLGWGVSHWLEAKGPILPRTRVLLIGLAGVMLLALGVSLVTGASLVPAALRPLYTPALTHTLLFLLVLTFGGAAYGLYQARTRWAFSVLGGGVALSMVFANLFLLPEVNAIMQNDMVACAQKAVAAGKPLATYRIRKPSLVFYAQRKIFFMPGEKKDVKRAKKNPELYMVMPSLYLVVKNKDVRMFAKRYQFQWVHPGRVYSLVHVENVLIRKDINE